MMQRMKLWMMAAILVISGATVLTSCSKDDDNKTVVQPVTKEYFTLWNQCEALTALQNYVKDVTNPSSPNFIKEEDRIATFDMDGTFVGELYPTYFEYNLLEYRVLDDPAYKDIAPDDVKETAQDIRDFVRNGTKLPSNFDMKHAYAAAKAYSGMTLKEFDDYVKAYAAKPANGFSGMTYGQSHYKPMLEVFDYLKDNGFTYYVVSGSDRFICRALVESIGIPMNRVIGMDVKLRSNKQNTDDGVSYTMGKEEELVRTDVLLIKNLKTNKVLQISQEIGKVPVLSFGNSSGDCSMHNYALGNQKYKSAAFMLVADDDVRDHANLAEGAKREAQWREAGYHVISMKNDFKTIYGDGVVKTDFTFPVDTRALTEWQAGRTVSQADVDAYGGIDKCFAAEPIPDGV
jgi:phosphoserine phosphatase